MFSDDPSDDEQVETVVRRSHQPQTIVMAHNPNIKTRMTEIVADISLTTQKDMVGMHVYVLRSATMLYGACCFLYPLMCLALLLMASEQTRDDFIKQPPPWVSTAAMYVYWHGFGAYFAVLVCSNVFLFVHGQWSTTHHAISKCAEMVTGRDTTEVRGLFGSSKTTGSTLSTLIQCLFVLLFVFVVGFMGWWFYVTFALNKKVDDVGRWGATRVDNVTSWGAAKVNSLGVGLWGFGRSLWSMGRSAFTAK